MRTGYAIIDKTRRGWLQARTRGDGAGEPVTVWVKDDAEALQFHRLKDAKAMLRVLRQDHPRPGCVKILDPRWRVIA